MHSRQESYESFVRLIKRHFQTFKQSDVYHTFNHPETFVQSRAPAKQETNRKISKTQG